VAGTVGLTAALATAICACLDETSAAAEVLIGGAVAAPLTYALSRVLLAFGGLLSKGPAWTSPKLTGDLAADLARIDASSPLHRIARRLGSLEAWSSALPLAAISLLAPLTLHFLFCLATGFESTRDFGKWIQISLVIVGHAHLTLMALAIAFSRKMARLETDQLARLSIHREWGKALGITVAVSAVPGVILLAVPPVLSAITGVVFVPFMFALMRRRVLSERATMQLAEEAVAVRIASDATTSLEAFHEATWPGTAENDAENRLAARL
jgi:hypothetical protein